MSGSSRNALTFSLKTLPSQAQSNLSYQGNSTQFSPAQLSRLGATHTPHIAPYITRYIVPHTTSQRPLQVILVP